MESAVASTTAGRGFHHRVHPPFRRALAPVGMPAVSTATCNGRPDSLAARQRPQTNRNPCPLFRGKVIRHLGAAIVLALQVFIDGVFVGEELNEGRRRWHWKILPTPFNPLGRSAGTGQIPTMSNPPLVYLAGPDVFLPGAGAWAERKKAICARHGLAGISPLDALAGEPAGWAALPQWHAIGLRNEAHIAGADAVIANLTPFRGPSADAGTVFEIGFMRALGRPVFGYATTAQPFTERTLQAIGARAEADRDAEGLLVERFGLFDNLMIVVGILASGGELIADELPPEQRWTDLTVFERCVARAAGKLLS
jgi:nucleoside 2-deoxyribosyltransferase